MLPVQRSRSASLVSFGLLALSSVVSNVQAWVKREIVDDDPWDRETLYPQAALEDVQRPPIEVPVYQAVDTLPPDR
jgi:hypothetical protein